MTFQHRIIHKVDYLLNIFRDLNQLVKWVFLIILVSVTSTACVAPMPPVGLYRHPSSACTEISDNKIQSCAYRFQDCLLIQKLPNGATHVEIFSTQAQQHVCMVNATVAVVNGAVILLDEEAGAGQGVQVALSGNAIVMSNLLPSTNGQKPFCGPHASLDGLRFELTSRVSETGICIPEDIK